LVFPRSRHDPELMWFSNESCSGRSALQHANELEGQTRSRNEVDGKHQARWWDTAEFTARNLKAIGCARVFWPRGFATVGSIPGRRDDPIVSGERAL